MHLNYKKEKKLKSKTYKNNSRFFRNCTDNKEQEIKTSKFVGNWILEKSEGFEEYLRATGNCSNSMLIPFQNSLKIIFN